MKTAYVGYAVPVFDKGNDRDGYLMGAGVMEIDLDSFDREDLRYMKENPDDQVETKPTKIHFIIDQSDRLNGNKFKAHPPLEVHVAWGDIHPSLKDAWNVIYKQKAKVFKEIFEVPWK